MADVTGEVPYKGSILAVDDTLENLDVLDELLTAQGYEVRRAINGAMALRAVAAEPPELILLDIMMPDMDGYEVCNQLKASHETWTIPIIFISALDDVLDKVKAFKMGGRDYLTKPFQAEEVLARVETHIYGGRMERILQERVDALWEATERAEKAEARVKELEEQLRQLTLEPEVLDEAI